MMSMSCKSQTEAFARSLQTKLQFLGSEALSINQYGGSAWSERQEEAAAFNYLGTTFPPRRCAQFDLLRSKYHSESDLAPKALLRAKTSKAMPSHSEDDDHDSDLFFDFDIGSPPLIPNPADTDPPSPHDDIFNDGRRDSSDSSAANSDVAKATSTAYGSASPGLCSDLEAAYQVDCSDSKREGFSFQPEDWLLSKHQKLNLADAHHADADLFGYESSGSSGDSSGDGGVSPSGDDAIPLDEEKLHHGACLATGRNGDKMHGSDDANDLFDSEAESINVFAGDCKHEIAHSKLNALLALLEKDKEYARVNSPPSETRSKESSPPNDDEDDDEVREGGVGIPSSPSKRSSYRSTLPTISASPANFSFLSASVAADDTSCPGHMSEKLLSRSVSTPDLTTDERALLESPKPRRRHAVVEPVKLVDESQAVEIPLTSDSEQPFQRRRASSLKSGKTPPGTPGRRKIVRFADVFGLDLADVKTFLDEIPKVPKSAYRDLKNADLDSDFGSDQIAEDTKVKSDPAARSLVAGTSLVPMFNQPGGFANFFDLLRDRKVCLENAFMAGPRTVKGTVRVQNVGFRKCLTVRYTANEWISSDDLEAQYMQGSCDGFSDKFTFSLTTEERLGVGQRLQFCLCFRANDCGDEYWDNNGGKNYVFQCLGGEGTNAPAAVPASKGSTPMAVLGGRTDLYSSNFSHSPAMSEEPWLRYL